MKTKKIIKTLKAIKNYCKGKAENCNNCIFENTSLCNDIPEKWNINQFKQNLKDTERI